MAYRLGLTGGIACGKSTIAARLRALGAEHVDADAISHALTAPGGKALPAIREAFGDSVFLPDGTLDRRVLASVIFADPERKKTLEAILHPMIGSEMLRLAAQSSARVCVLDVPLLYEAGMEHLCDEVWVVSMPEQLQCARVCERDHCTPQEALARIKNQMPLREKERRADRVFMTDKTIEETMRETEEQYAALLARLQ